MGKKIIPARNAHAMSTSLRSRIVADAVAPRASATTGLEAVRAAVVQGAAEAAGL